MNPGPPTLEASTLPLGYRGGSKRYKPGYYFTEQFIHTLRYCIKSKLLHQIQQNQINFHSDIFLLQMQVLFHTKKHCRFFS